MRSFGLQIGLLILALISGSGAGQSVILPSWPARTLSLITPAPPGGAVDLTARVAGDKLAERLGRPVVVDSRPGADGIIAAEAFLGARDKDHTFLVRPRSAARRRMSAVRCPPGNAIRASA